MRAIACLGLVLLTLAAPVARADDTADEAEFRFRRAAELYQKARFDEALSEFFASNRLVRNRNVIFNIARCFEQIGQLNEAYRYFNDLTGEWPADDRASLEQALERMRPKVALVRVVTNPPGADVFVDRRDLGSRGSSPRTLALPPGSAKVLVDLRGWRSGEQSVVLEKGREAVVELTLERIYGFLEAASSPPGARVSVIDDASVAPCVTPCSLRVLPGKHTLAYALDGHLPQEREVQVGFDEHLPVAVALVPRPPPTGKLVVTANKDGALVVVDGRESGFTPVVVEGVVVGEHLVKVSYDEFEPWSQKVVVQEGESTSLRARLSVPAPQVAAAAKTLTKSEDAPASVTVITSDEIRAFGWRSLAQAVRGLRGFAYNNDRIYESLGVRGFSPPGDFNMRLQVLVDGHSWNDVWVQQGGVGWDFDVDLAEVERIEVVRGPASALYGSSAVFAVINVVHRTKPAEGDVEASVSGGNAGYARGRVTAGVDRKDWGASVSVATTEMAGDREVVYPPSSSELAGRTVKNGDYERAKHAQVLGRYGELSFVGVVNDRYRDLPSATYFGAGGATDQRTSHSTDLRGFAELRWEHPLADDGQLAVRGYYDAYAFDARWAYDHQWECVDPGNDRDHCGPDFYREEDYTSWVGAELRLRTGPLLGLHRVTAGLEYQHWIGVAQYVWDATHARAATGAANPPYLDMDRSADIGSAYVMDSMRFSDALTLEAGTGVRVDRHSGAFESPNFSPRAALVWRSYADGLTKVIVGRAFRVANMYERYYTDGTTQLPAVLPLAPEAIVTGELEHTHRVNEEVLAIGDVFYNRLTNVIALQTNSETDSRQIARNNAAAISAIGAEAEVRWQPSRLSLVAFNYSFQYSTDPATNGAALPNSPRHQVALRAMHPITASVSLAGEALWGSGRRTANDGDVVGESLVVNAALTGDLRRWGLRYALRAYNLFDEQYAFPAGKLYWNDVTPQYGRLVEMSLTATY